ncbi:hypothetical protein [Phascolarctobacterium succinatutens]|uniref:hypothetical protein n=1 Tax=Phascolarctobacterium succinatutens TaxID=626940 RepID=UPI00307EA564
MAYTVYTYVDPYRINETDFWAKIKSYPHLCASRTLVNGLMSVMGDSIESLICPIDEIVVKKVYKEWSADIGNRIQQYSELGKIFDQDFLDRKFEREFYEALKHNKNSMLDALRLFIELGIDPFTLNGDELPPEQKYFIYLFQLVSQKDLFKINDDLSVCTLKKILLEQVREEWREKEKRAKEYDGGALSPEEQAVFRRMNKTVEEWDCKHIVIHGIHQFSPIQLKFITHLERLGLDIVFIHNYVKEYKEIYSSWDYIYQHFNAQIHYDKNIEKYSPIEKKVGYTVACNMASLCEGNISLNDKQLFENYKVYNDDKYGLRFTEFDSISEYAGYVSDLFAAAEGKIITTKSAKSELLQKKSGTSNVLKKMKDVIYTANKDVDALLQIYHPDYARNRHFLAYPVGHFFVSLYDLWNTERKEIVIDYKLILNCLNSGIMTSFDSSKLVKTLMNLEPLFAIWETFTEFRSGFTDYIKLYDQVSATTINSQDYTLRELNIYNNEKVTKTDVVALYNAVCELNTNAVSLFKNIENGEQFGFSDHLGRLKEFISKRQPKLANKEEKELVEKLLTRLDDVQGNMDHEKKGTFDDLRAGLYFFMKQKEEPVSDWFVKNFEQIDGDVLNSKAQNKIGRGKTYHFACVSDKDMNCKINDLLPWPLSEYFIEKAYNPKDLQFQVYFASLSERSNFLRYELFFGLYYCQCDVKISFVRYYDEDETDLYQLLKLIGLKKVTKKKIKAEGNTARTKDKFNSDNVKKLNIMPEERGAMFLCPYKYLMNYVINSGVTYSGKFFAQRFFIAVITDRVWKRIDSYRYNPDKAKENMVRTMDMEIEILRTYFPFMSASDIIDVKRQVKNYLDTRIQGGYDPNHTLNRKVFGKGLFYESIDKLPPNHIYDFFENFTRIEDDKKIYSVSAVTKNVKQKAVIDSYIQKYLNEQEDACKRPGSWCGYCTVRNVCLAPYEEE